MQVQPPQSFCSVRLWHSAAMCDACRPLSSGCTSSATSRRCSSSCLSPAIFSSLRCCTTGALLGLSDAHALACAERNVQKYEHSKPHLLACCMHQNPSLAVGCISVLASCSPKNSHFPCLSSRRVRIPIEAALAVAVGFNLFLIIVAIIYIVTLKVTETPPPSMHPDLQNSACSRAVWNLVFSSSHRRD